MTGEGGTALTTSALEGRAVGICIRTADRAGAFSAEEEFADYLASVGLASSAVVTSRPEGTEVRVRLADEFIAAWMPGFDTTRIRERSCRDPLGRPRSPVDLEGEILIAMLASPVIFEFPSLHEMQASIRIRVNIAAAAARTVLSFHTTRAERPDEYWCYDRERGFTVRPDRSLIEALRQATQPQVSGTLYSFSCYRATEYVILLGIAMELATHNPPLLAELQRQCQTRVIRSAQFHDNFMIEYGSMEKPLPPKYYVPGDRLWFRNPDEASSDITGYEGSWVFYMGDGLFSNFWKQAQPYTLDAKCIEIFHWRDGIRRNSGGELSMDEDIVEARVSATRADPNAAARIVARMMRMRDPRGIYAEGGCIDTTREYPRRTCPGTADLVLPCH